MPLFDCDNVKIVILVVDLFLLSSSGSFEYGGRLRDAHRKSDYFHDFDIWVMDMESLEHLLQLLSAWGLKYTVKQKKKSVYPNYTVHVHNTTDRDVLIDVNVGTTFGACDFTCNVIKRFNCMWEGLKEETLANSHTSLEDARRACRYEVTEWIGEISGDKLSAFELTRHFDRMRSLITKGFRVTNAYELIARLCEEWTNLFEGRQRNEKTTREYWEDKL